MLGLHSKHTSLRPTLLRVPPSSNSMTFYLVELLIWLLLAPSSSGCNKPQLFEVDEAALALPGAPLRHVSTWDPASGKWRLTVRPQADPRLGQLGTQQPMGPLRAWRRVGLSGERLCVWLRHYSLSTAMPPGSMSITHTVTACFLTA